MEKCIGFRATFRRDRANTLCLKLHLLPFGFMATVPNNWCQKSWSLYIQGRWKSLYQRITVQLTKLPHFLCHVLLPKWQSAISLVWILPYNFFLCGVSFATVQTKIFYDRMPCFMEVSVHMQCFVPTRTNFVKNIKPQYSNVFKFCTDRWNYVNLR